MMKIVDKALFLEFRQRFRGSFKVKIDVEEKIRFNIIKLITIKLIMINLIKN